MVSGVSFRNPQSQRTSRVKKKAISFGLLFMALITGLVFAVYGIGVYLRESARTAATTLDDEIQRINADIAQHTEEASRPVQSLVALDKELYAGHGADTVLAELERTIVPRVVLLSLEYAQNTRAQGGEEVYQLSITGDVETFDALAAQIKSWKESPLFRNVRAGGTTRDEDSGRLIFVVEMDLIEATPEQSNYATPRVSSTTENDSAPTASALDTNTVDAPQNESAPAEEPQDTANEPIVQ